MYSRTNGNKGNGMFNEPSEYKYYIAYGSNLNLAQMKIRCPGATVVGKTELQGYKLVFRGVASGGVATLEEEQGAVVPALIWRVNKKDEANLDSYEGYPRLYHKETWTVQVNGETIEAFIYIMNEGHELARPMDMYFFIILSGYDDAGFDREILYNAMISQSNVDQAVEALYDQIMIIRDSGVTNMLDVRTVQDIAAREGFSLLSKFLKDFPMGYWNFIMSGDREPLKKAVLSFVEDGFLNEAVFCGERGYNDEE